VLLPIADDKSLENRLTTTDLTSNPSGSREKISPPLSATVYPRMCGSNSRFDPPTIHTAVNGPTVDVAR
jgi:hypothetical protein